MVKKVEPAKDMIEEMFTEAEKASRQVKRRRKIKWQQH